MTCRLHEGLRQQLVADDERAAVARMLKLTSKNQKKTQARFFTKSLSHLRVFTVERTQCMLPST